MYSLEEIKHNANRASFFENSHGEWFRMNYVSDQGISYKDEDTGESHFRLWKDINENCKFYGVYKL